MKITIEIPSFYHEEGNWVKHNYADEDKTLTPVPITDKAQIVLLILARIRSALQLRWQTLLNRSSMSAR